MIMKIKILFYLSAVIIFAVLSMHGCYDDHGWSRSQSYYKITVDSITFPAQNFTANDTLRIALWGVIGEDSCYSFSYFQESGSSHLIDLALWGLHDYVPADPSSGCTTAKILLNGMIYRVYPVEQGMNTVVIHQPGGSNLYKQVFIY